MVIDQEILEIKTAVVALTKSFGRDSFLRLELIKRLIEIFEINEDRGAVDFWKDQI